MQAMRSPEPDPAHDTAPVIAPATENDVERLTSIWHLGWQDGHRGFVPDEVLGERTEADFRRRTRARFGEMQVLRTADDLAGFFIVVEDEVEQIYVGRDHRGSGVASELLGAAEERIAAAGYAQAWLAVVAGNARARAFYAKQGWTDGGPFPYVAEGRNGPIEVPSHRYEKDLLRKTG